MRRVELSLNLTNIVMLSCERSEDLDEICNTAPTPAVMDDGNFYPCSRYLYFGKMYGYSLYYLPFFLRS